MRGDVLRANYGSNPWQERPGGHLGLVGVARRRCKESLLRTHWDLIIVDEAHKMSPTFGTSRRSPTIGTELSQDADHHLLMTATPHKGDPENFCLFLELLDNDVYGDVKSLEERAEQEAPFYLRRVKEALVAFPDPETGEVKELFTKRICSHHRIQNQRGRI